MTPFCPLSVDTLLFKKKKYILLVPYVKAIKHPSMRASLAVANQKKHSTKSSSCLCLPDYAGLPFP